MLRDAWLVATKDLQIEWRSRVTFGQVVPFAGLVLVLFGFALDANRPVLLQATSGLFWVTIMFVSTLAVQRSTSIETTDGARRALLLAGIEPPAVFVGKSIAVAVQLLVVEIVLLIGVVVLYSADIEAWGQAPSGSQIPDKADILFPKKEREEVEKTGGQAAKKPASSAQSEAKIDEVSIDDFARIALRVARVVSAQKVEKADKLLKLQLDVGDEERTVVSGIAQWYQPADLVGRRVVLVANLKPAKLRGIVSQGMILAADDGEGNLVLVEPGGDIAVGAEVR